MASDDMASTVGLGQQTKMVGLQKRQMRLESNGMVGQSDSEDPAASVML